MKPYLDSLRDVLENGTDVSDRTGVGTRALFGQTTRYDLRAGFPAVTTKRLAWRSVVGELLWFLEGSTDERRLAELTYGRPRAELTKKGTIWQANYEEFVNSPRHLSDDVEGVHQMGPMYGEQWREFKGVGKNGVTYVDQVWTVLDQLRHQPDSRRIILTSWNPAVLREVALPACHALSQFRVVEGRLSCSLTQRSGDMFLGVPFNVASYALLTHMFARESGLEVGELVHHVVDAHLYSSHLEQAREQLSREPFPLPVLSVSGDFDLRDRVENGFRLDDVDRFTLVGYRSHDSIRAEMAV